MDHFAIEPKKCLANPADVPLFLSVRIVDEEINADSKLEGGAYGGNMTKNENRNKRNPVDHIYQYEQDSAKFAREFEENMVRF